MQTEQSPMKLRDNPLHPWTGPITEAGKAIAAMNSLKHGLTARRAVLPGENKEEFDTLVAQLLAEHAPCGALETELVNEIAACLWRLQRARAQESHNLHRDGAKIFSGDADTGRAFDRVLRYVAAIERELHRSIVRLQQLQTARRMSEFRPAVQQSRPDPAPKVMVAGRTPVFPSMAAPDHFVSSNAPHTSQPVPEPRPTLVRPTQNGGPESR